MITDRLANTSAAVAANEELHDLRDAVDAVLRGISFTPGTTSPLPLTRSLTA